MSLTPSSITFFSPVSFQLPSTWRFDPLSALIGAAIAFILMGLLYIFREQLRAAWERLVAPVDQLTHRLQSDAETQYRERVVGWSRTLPFLGDLVPLHRAFIEPELLVPPPSPTSLVEVEIEDAHWDALPLSRILSGHPLLVLNGGPGLGKTSLLAYLAWVSARGSQDEADSEEQLDPPPVEIHGADERLPVYVPLTAIEWGEGPSPMEDEEGERATDSPPPEMAPQPEDLLPTALAVVGGRKRWAGALQPFLENGEAILLVDGWDDLQSHQRDQAAEWLAQCIDRFEDNVWIVGAGEWDYASLTEAGFVPVKLQRWTLEQVIRFANGWLEADPAFEPTPQEEPEREPEPHEDETETSDAPTLSREEFCSELTTAAARGWSPLELAMGAFVLVREGQAPFQRGTLFDHTLDLLLWDEERPWIAPACRVALIELATRLQQGGRQFATRDEVETLIEDALLPSEERPPNAARVALKSLLNSPALLQEIGANKVTFAHTLWQKYLTARKFVAEGSEPLADHLDDPEWSEVLGFYAELGDIGPLIVPWLQKPDDIFHRRLRTLGAWIGAAPEDAPWKQKAMTILARSFLKAGQSAETQKALAEALVETNVPGVFHVFKRALQQPDAGLREAGVWGLAHLESAAVLPHLKDSLDDPAVEVREAAIQGLAQMRTEGAARILEDAFLEVSDDVRPLVAEALAKSGDASFLREAAEADDLSLRRAAVYGLAEAGDREALEQMAREDGQWIVRSAAAAALDEIRASGEEAAVPSPPKIEQLPWLISWAAERGTGVGVGEAAREMVRTVLREGNVTEKVIAAQLLIWEGRPEDVEILRGALSEDDLVLQQVAWAALTEIAKRYDLWIEG